MNDHATELLTLSKSVLRKHGIQNDILALDIALLLLDRQKETMKELV